MEVRQIDPDTNQPIEQANNTQSPAAARAAVIIGVLVMLSCACIGAWQWFGSTAATPTPTAEVVDGEAMAEADTPTDTPEPTETPDLLATATALAEDSRRKMLESNPDELYPSLVGYVMYEYLVRATNVSTSINVAAATESPYIIQTHVPCQYSNVLLNATGQLYYLYYDHENFRFDGDPTLRFGQFIVKRVELAPDKKCKYPLLKLVEYYPFDQHVPANPITKVGEEYVQPFAEKPINPTPTPTSPFGPMAVGQRDPAYYNTPLAPPTPTYTPMPMTLRGQLIIITDCVQSNIALQLPSGQVVYTQFDNMAQVNLGRGVTLVGQPAAFCGRQAILVQRAMYDETPTPVPTNTPQPAKTPAPTATPYNIMLTGSVQRGVSGCNQTDVAMTSMGKLYYLLFDSLMDIPAGEVTIFGQYSQTCGNAIQVQQLSTPTAPTPTPTIESVESFDDVGLGNKTGE